MCETDEKIQRSNIEMKQNNSANYTRSLFTFIVKYFISSGQHQ